jgi:hypothetical protein
VILDDREWFWMWFRRKLMVTMYHLKPKRSLFSIYFANSAIISGSSRGKIYLDSFFKASKEDKIYRL